MARLLFASVDFLPQIGGVSLASHHIANAFARLGHEVVVLAGPHAEDGSEYRAEYRVIADLKGCPRLREGSEWIHKERPRLISLVESIWQKHSFDRAVALHPFYYGPAVQHVAANAGCPFSVMFHGFELRSQLVFQERLRALMALFKGKGPTLRQVTLNLVRSADEVLVNSHYTSTIVQRTGTRAPTIVTGCGLDEVEAKGFLGTAPDQAAKERDVARAKLGVKNNEFLLGTICRLVPTKNVDVMLDAVARSPNAKGLVIGTGPEIGRLEARANAADLKGRIIFKQGVGEEDKWKHLRALDCFCLLSRMGERGQVEGFGIVLLEASAAGVPVIISNSGGMVDVVQDGRTGLVTEVNCVGEVVKAMERLRNDPTLRQSLVAGAQNQITAKFNWTSIAQRLNSHWKLADLNPRRENALD